MTIAIPANTRVLVVGPANKPTEFFDCIAVELSNEVTVEAISGRIVISIGDLEPWDVFLTTLIEIDKIRFVLIDPSRKSTANQGTELIAIAEVDDFDESMPGKVHFI